MLNAAVYPEENIFLPIRVADAHTDEDKDKDRLDRLEVNKSEVNLWYNSRSFQAFLRINEDGANTEIRIKMLLNTRNNNKHWIERIGRLGEMHRN